MSDDTWVDAGYAQLTGEDKSLWVRSQDGSRVALSKPGPGEPNSTHAFNEYVASIIAHWIGVRVPRVELYVFDGRPVALSMKATGRVIAWQRLKASDYDLWQFANKGLQALAPVIALDALLGVGNRPVEHDNHIYVEDQREWYSVDYADLLRPRFELEYQPEFAAHVQSAQVAISRTLDEIEKIPCEAIRNLIGVAPDAFASAQERAKVLRFIVDRRSMVRQVVSDWRQARCSLP